MARIDGSNGNVKVESAGKQVVIGIEFQDGRWRETYLTWINARRFAYAILEETDKMERA